MKPSLASNSSIDLNLHARSVGHNEHHPNSSRKVGIVDVEILCVIITHLSFSSVFQ